MDYELRAAKALAASLGNTFEKKVKVPRYVEPKPPKPDLAKIARKIESVVGEVIPDCDPIDWLGPYVRREYGVEYCGELLDKAARKHLGVKSYNEYLIQSWDAYNEVVPEDQKMDNPWK